jgi:lipopolysaccharide transport system permease protein
MAGRLSDAWLSGGGERILRLVEQQTQAPPAPLGTVTRPRGRTVRLERTHGFGRLSPGELWRFRDVAVQIAARDVKVRYRQTVLGAAWAILQPAGTMLVFCIFFGRLAHFSGVGSSYALVWLAGLVPWTYFSNAVLLGSDSLVSNAPLVSKVYFPRIFIPAGVVAAGLVDLCIGLVILLVTVAFTEARLAAPLLALPLLVLIMVAATLGVSTGLSAVNVRYRDVRYVVPFMVQLWLFATPIAYPSTLLHEPWRTVSAIDPMTGVVEGFRWAILGRPAAPWTLIGISAASAAVLLLAGLLYFDRVERRFADVL